MSSWTRSKDSRPSILSTTTPLPPLFLPSFGWHPTRRTRKKHHHPRPRPRRLIPEVVVPWIRGRDENSRHVDVSTSRDKSPRRNYRVNSMLSPRYFPLLFDGREGARRCWSLGWMARTRQKDEEKGFKTKSQSNGTKRNGKWRARWLEVGATEIHQMEEITPVSMPGTMTRPADACFLYSLPPLFLFLYFFPVSIFFPSLSFLLSTPLKRATRFASALCFQDSATNERTKKRTNERTNERRIVGESFKYLGG